MNFLYLIFLIPLIPPDEPPIKFQPVIVQFKYWAGIETNYSQMQTSTDMIHWQTLPELYYGAPSTNYADLISDKPQQFWRMIKVDAL